jgi:signal transduction histidine kinase
MRKFSIALTLALVGTFCSAAPLTTTRAIRELDRDTAAKSLPIKLTGVVSFCVPSALGGFVLENEGTGIWVGLFSSDKSGNTTTWAQEISAAPPSPEEQNALRVILRQLKPGMKLEVTGISVPGGFAPSIAATQLRILTENEVFPEAPVLDPSRFVTGMLDCQRVVVEGVVQEVLPKANDSATHSVTQLMLAIPGLRIRCSIWAEPSWSREALIGARVRAEAVCATVFNERGETVSVFLQASSFARWSILNEAPANPFDAPTIQAGQMLPFRASGPVLTRQKLSGVFSYGQPGSFLNLDTEARSVRINTSDKMAFSPGDLIEAAGFVELREGFAEMVGASVRPVGIGKPPQIASPKLADLLASPNSSHPVNPEDYQNRLVRLSGIFQHQEQLRETHTRLYLLSGTQEFTALLPSGSLQLADLRPGSELELTGICQLDYGTEAAASLYANAKAVTLLLRSTNDMRLIHQAPWWTSQRLLMAIAVTGVVLALALIWAAQLRRLVSQRSAELAREIAGREQAQITFQATLSERQRMAADLHDGMEQTLNGLALQLQAAQRFLHDSPQRTEQHLDLSLSFLDSSRDELRRSVWDLRSEGLAGKTFAQALEDFIPQWSAGSDLQMHIETAGDPRPITDHIASNLLMLVREAVNNALKHGRATIIEIKLAFEPEQLELTLTDNGLGFDPKQAPGPSHGHFGLQGMRERMARIQGRLEIRSSLGSGTTVIVTVPHP